MARRTKYTYGQFARVAGERYRVRKVDSSIWPCEKCTLHETAKCKLLTELCVNLIPTNAYFEKV